MNGWQPIDTAPKNGMQVLVCRRDADDPCDMVLVRWNGTGWWDGDYTWDSDDFDLWHPLPPLPDA